MHPNQNMDQQARYDPQEPNPFFDDSRASRPQVEGTVAYGTHRLDQQRYGQMSSGLTISRELLSRGQDRYEIYCTPCHGGVGLGDGIVVVRGLEPQASSFHDARLRQAPLGYFVEVITVGVRTMRALTAQVTVEDRWAIAAYVRTLQISRSVAGEPIELEEGQGPGEEDR